MSLNAWTRELGTRQGRIAPLGVTPPAGAEAFCLGFDLPNHFDQLVDGDYAQVEQVATFTPGTKIFRARAIMRPPRVVPDGVRWVLSMLVDGVELTAIELRPGGPTRARLLSANVSKLSGGAHTVTLRLGLQSTTHDVLITQGGARILTEGNFAIVVEA